MESGAGLVNDPNSIEQVIDHLFRHESGKMVAVLSRMFGIQDLEFAEDVVQETMIKALSQWKFHGIPENAQAWLYTVAKRKVIDELRRRRLNDRLPNEHTALLSSEWTLSSTVDQFFLESEIEDSQLRMFFACCHPSIPQESQIALVLKTLCGFGVDEIARAFLSNEETIAKRLYRAKEKLRSETITLEVPVGSELEPRLDSVLQCIYLMFNEGYSSSHPDTIIRRDLSLEAMRLCKLLTEHPLTNKPYVNALMALLCYGASRFDARLDEHGNIMRLTEQDRNKWDRQLIKIGNYYLGRSAIEENISKYHLEAAIMSVHAEAEQYEETNWSLIVELYDQLLSSHPSSVIRLNRAIALGYARSPEEAISELLSIKGLDSYYLYHAALGDLYFRIKDFSKARQSFEEAISKTASRSEQELLLRKIKSVE